MCFGGGVSSVEVEYIRDTFNVSEKKLCEKRVVDLNMSG
jgi:hypothetical protein